MDYDDYDDYDDYAQAPGMGQDPFADYDYETLRAYYQQFKDSDPQMAQMLEMGMMRKKMEMEAGGGGGKAGHRGPKPVKIKQFNERSLVESCTANQTLSLVDTLHTLLLCLVIYRVLKATVFKLFSKGFQHFMTAAIGVVVLCKSFESESLGLIFPLLGFFVAMKILLYGKDPEPEGDGKKNDDDDDDDKPKEEKQVSTPKPHERKSVIFPTLLLLSITISSEIYYPQYKWYKVRATNMILSFKLLAALGESSRLTLIESLGYILHPASLIYGPWTSVDVYLNSFDNQKFGFTSLFNLKTYFLALVSAVLSYICYILSSCITPFIFGDPYISEEREDSMRAISGYHLSRLRLSGTLVPEWDFHIILYAIEIAVTFRIAWYYIGFLSNSLAILTDQVSVEQGPSVFAVCNPFTVEFPFCLSSILKDWNKPIAEFLSCYIYRPTYYSLKERYGGLGGRSFLGFDLRNAYPVFSILFTFIVSGLFHGVKVKIFVVLVSICLFSYVQFNFRRQLALTFDNPGLAPNCYDKRKFEVESASASDKKCSKKVRFVLNPLFKFFFLIVNYIHLTQLGYLMLRDEFEDEDPFTIREDLKVVHVMLRSMGYASFYICGGFLTFWLFTR